MKPKLAGHIVFYRIFLAFFLSGVSGLIYQMTWVRLLGNLLGNTLQSVSIVTGVFMLGLGAGAYLMGKKGDLGLGKNPLNPLKMFVFVEMGIALSAAVVYFVIPQINSIVSVLFGYEEAANGWFILKPGVFFFRTVISFLFIFPSTFLMGGTLTLLIRYQFSADISNRANRVGLLYGVNTAGAALVCLLGELLLVKNFGVSVAYGSAVGCNLISALLVFSLLKKVGSGVRSGDQESSKTGKSAGKTVSGKKARQGVSAESKDGAKSFQGGLLLSFVFLSGMVGLSLELLWYRFFSTTIGEYRGVFTLLLFIILTGLFLGAFAAGRVLKLGLSPVGLLILCQIGILISSLFGFHFYSDPDIEMIKREFTQNAGKDHYFFDLINNGRAMVVVMAIPALLLGFTFPVANEIYLKRFGSAAGDSGRVYLLNTLGALSGSLTMGFLMIPWLGMKNSFTFVLLLILLGLCVLAVMNGRTASSLKWSIPSLLIGLIGGIYWFGLPSDYILQKAVLEKINVKDFELLSLKEGEYQTVTVFDATNNRMKYRSLYTNGHSMSGTHWNGRRYMGLFAHLPLIQHPAAKDALLICYGVGNTAHTILLYPELESLEIVELSENVLSHAKYFEHINGKPLEHSKSKVFINDGRLHLQMKPPESYDLITLEPPPIAHANVASLYSTEFYKLAKSRLRKGGYISQWLPIKQLSKDNARSLVKSFVDVFPQSVLIEGDDHDANFILLGINDDSIHFDVQRAQSVWVSNPQIREDLRNIRISTVEDLVGLFVSDGAHMTEELQDDTPVTDDHPVMEFDRISNYFQSEVPVELFNELAVQKWCPDCFDSGNGPLGNTFDGAFVRRRVQNRYTVHRSAAFYTIGNR